MCGENHELNLQLKLQTYLIILTKKYCPQLSRNQKFIIFKTTLGKIWAKIILAYLFYLYLFNTGWKFRKAITISKFSPPPKKKVISRCSALPFPGFIFISLSFQ